MIQRRSKANRRSEQGIALFVAIFTVLLITAIGAGMIITNTDTSISANFRDEQTDFVGAKAGMEEIRDRFRSSANNSLAANLPTALPGNETRFYTSPIRALLARVVFIFRSDSHQSC